MDIEKLFGKEDYIINDEPIIVPSVFLPGDSTSSVSPDIKYVTIKEEMEYVSNSEEERIIEDIRKNRKELYSRLEEITNRRKKIENQIEKMDDYRKKWYSIEMVKLIQQNSEIELKIIERIDSSLKTEFDMIKKIKTDNDIDISSERVEFLTEIFKKKMEVNKKENKDV